MLSAAEAQQAAVGSALLAQSGVDALLETEPAAFDGPARFARLGAAELAKRDAPVDVLGLAAEGARLGADQAELTAWLLDAMTSVPTAANARHFCGLVVDAWRRSRLLQALDSARAQAESASSAKEAAAAIAGALDGMPGEASAGMGPRSAADTGREALELATRRHTGQEAPVSSGVEALDRVLSMLPGNLVVVAGRPGMGKTALALQAAAYQASKGQPSLVYSLEMAAAECQIRVACSYAGLEAEPIVRGEAPQSAIDALAEALQDVSAWPLWIDDDTGLSVPLMRARARALRRRLGKLSLVVVDYLQLVGSDAAGSGPGHSREREVAVMSRGCKLLARELGCPLMLLAQLSRKCEERPDKRPHLSDLRESGAIEQDADSVVMTYRPSVYGEPGHDELLVRKQRHGRLGTAQVSFEAELMRFEPPRPSGPRYAD